MVFKYCRKCFGMRQFIPNVIKLERTDYIQKRHCDVCGVDE